MRLHGRLPDVEPPGDLRVGDGAYASQRTSADQLKVPDPRPALRRVPVLVLRGDCDHKNPGIAREYADVLPEATLVTVPDAGHLIDTEQPEAYRRGVTRFLS
ncbi:alpha/beta fold hydrolase [Streptomyces sp. NPDC005728]|uniref:alpha/beta fold hydrolase n=1 Tax=Streptomyces sp. NPDC005728 TaxID=3157054 RepID=UPI0034069DEA